MPFDSERTRDLLDSMIVSPGIAVRVAVAGRWLRWLVLAGVLASPVAGKSEALAQSPGQWLRLSERVGQTSRYRMTFDMQMRAEYRGLSEVEPEARELLTALAEGMQLRTVMDYEQRLVEVELDGTRAFEVRWHDYSLTGELGGRKIAPPVGHVESTRALFSEPARVRTTATGRTIDVVYSNPLLARLAGALQPLDGAMPTSLPGRPVRVGDRWTSTAKIPMALPAGGKASMTFQLEHRLSEVRDGPRGPVAVIELSGTYSQLEGSESAVLAEPLHMQATLTGSSLFAIDQGRFVGGSYELDMFALHPEGGIEIQFTGHANGDLELLEP